MTGSEIIKTLLILILTTGLVFATRFSRFYNSNAILFTESHVVLLNERLDTNALIRTLEEMGAEFNEDELRWAAGTLGWSTFLSGRYDFHEGAPYQEFLSRMALGMQDPMRVTILPGSDPYRFSGLMGQRFRADSTEFLEVFRDSAELALEHNLRGDELFARMLPDTYDFYWTSDAVTVISRILREFNNRVTEGMAAEISRSPLSLNEIVTLASITELEARYSDEKARISGLYLNRLETGMLLQADPTVLYSLGERRRLLFEDYRVEHPYNTYLHPGLPPGPITNPDLASIRSVLNPEQHDYLYMVATPDGYHKFSRTFSEHRQASEEWRRWIQEQYRIRDEGVEQQTGETGIGG